MHSQFWWVHPRGSPDWTHPTLCPLVTPDRQHVTGVNHRIRWQSMKRWCMTQRVPPCVPWWHLTDSMTGANHWIRWYTTEHVPMCELWQDLTNNTQWHVSIRWHMTEYIPMSELWQDLTNSTQWHVSIRWHVTECIPTCDTLLRINQENQEYFVLCGHWTYGLEVKQRNK